MHTAPSAGRISPSKNPLKRRPRFTGRGPWPSSLPHGKPLALIRAEIECRDGSSFGGLLIRCFDGAKILGALAQDRYAPRSEPCSGGFLLCGPAHDQSFQNPLKRSERSSVYRRVCMILRWPRKCCSARGSKPSLANLN